MIYIQWDGMRAANDMLLAQFDMVQFFCAELRNAQSVLASMESETLEETAMLLQKEIRGLEEEAQQLKKMSECLRQIIEISCRTEQQIADTYNLEQTPQGITKFAKSIVGMGRRAATYSRLIVG